MRNRLRNASASERFEEFVVKRENGCWIWRDRPEAYGKIRVAGKSILAHRYSFDRFVGPIGVGLFVCHKCDTPGCVNPDHLYAGTHEDNNRDKVDRNRGRSKKHQDGWEKTRATTPEIRELINRDYKDGMTQIQLAIKYRVSQATISCAVRGAHNQGVRDNSPKKRRTGNFKSKISADQRQEIREKYASGAFTQTQLAVEYGVTQTRVSDIITGRDLKRATTIPLNHSEFAP